MTSLTELDDRIRSLCSEGRHAEAAQLCRERGDPVRASNLFAEVWQYDEAIRSAELAERWDIAYRHAISSGDRTAEARVLSKLRERADQAILAAAYADSKGRSLDAARLHEAAGDLEGAAVRYEAATEFFEAARCLSQLGEYRRAGILLERRLKTSPDDVAAALELGRILAQFGRFEHAARALQKAADDPEIGNEAQKILVACFAALSMNQAAEACLDRLRVDHPDIPLTVRDYLVAAYGSERGLLGLGADGENAQLLSGRYRIQRTLGAGATGRVLLARDVFYGREVAIKVLTVGSGATGRDAYLRFAREARIAAGLEHPNVVRVFEFNPDGPFLVMEYMEGGTLEDRFAASGMERALSLPMIRALMLSMLDGLEAVHRCGVVHRDLKPANIFVSNTFGVKIGDFGVAHLADLGATLTGAMLGTLAYMAPEQITGSTQPEAATDLYALGIILYRLLTARLPFPGPDFLAQHLHSEPPKVSDVVPAFGDRFDRLIAGLLAKSLDSRARSAADVRDAIAMIEWPNDEERIAPLPSAAERASSPPAAEPTANARYALVGHAIGETQIARDTVLDRAVRLIPFDVERAAWFRRYARIDSPFLQAVYEVDESNGWIVCEHPSGVPWPEARLPSEMERQREAEYAIACERLRVAGMWHESFAARKAVVVSASRAVLCVG